MGVKTTTATTGASSLTMGATHVDLQGASPTSGQVLTASSGSVASWVTPYVVTPADPRLADDRTASGVRTASTVVVTSGALAPTSGQVLTATSSTTAAWQTPSGAPSFSQVQTALASASGSVSFNSQKITSLLDPTAAQDCATKSYVDAVASGLDPKNSVRAATTGSSITLSGGAPNTLDGVSLALNNRILVKDQSTASQNGIYSVTTLGTGANGTWARASDADTSAEVTSGLFTFVTNGTANGGNGFVLTSDDPITLGTTALTFTQFSGAGQITANAPLSKSGNTLSISTVGDGSGTSSSSVLLASDSRLNNDRTANGFRTATTVVAFSGVTAPTSGQVLTATSSTAATWQTPSGAPSFSQVQTALAAASGSVSFNSQKITSLLNPTAAQDGATKNYVDTLYIAPTINATAITANAVTLDLNTASDWVIGNSTSLSTAVLASNVTVTFSNPAIGKQGIVLLKHDSSGTAFTATFAVSGATYTVVKDSNLSDYNPSSAANSLTLYAYAMFTVAGTNYLQIAKSFLV
jgi:hypothetical protein